MTPPLDLNNRLILGVDPGPVPGVVALILADWRIVQVECAQVTALLIGPLLKTLVKTYEGTGAGRGRTIIGVERFVVGPRAARSSTPGAGATTRDMVGQVQALGEQLGCSVVMASASVALTWAADERLKKAGIVVPKGMVHAKSAARHALYTAVKHGHLPDPLSKKAKR